jgi:hypothetical protein
MVTMEPGGVRVMLGVGKIYRLKFPGIAARVIKPPAGYAPPNFPYLVESLFLRSRWYVNARGEPAYADAPRLIVTPAREAVGNLSTGPANSDRSGACRASINLK